jgi:RNA polymerase sigma-70 factor, ECF subfamily
MNEPKRQSDFSLAALKAGDREEFARLVDVYSGPIYRLALKILNDAQDAEEVLQETFIKAFRHLATFEGRSSLSTWLYRIAVNEALMMVRQRRPNMVSTDEEISTNEGEFEPLQIVDWHDLPEDDLLSSETQSVLDAAIQQLSETLKVVFVLRDIQDLSVKETAEALNLSETAVKTRLLRARLRLRDILSTYFKERLQEDQKRTEKK